MLITTEVYPLVVIALSSYALLVSTIGSGLRAFLREGSLLPIPLNLFIFTKKHQLDFVTKTK